jgi:hypothetical protein
MSIHLEKLFKCFLKCKEYCVNLNPDKCAFLVCFGTILGVIPNPKKIEALIKMPIPKTPQEIQVFDEMA